MIAARTKQAAEETYPQTADKQTWISEMEGKGVSRGQALFTWQRAEASGLLALGTTAYACQEVSISRFLPFGCSVDA